jgi:hypothetical protein
MQKIHDDANCNLIWHHSPFFPNMKKTHSQSVSLYLWHREEYDFDFVM